MKNLLILAQRSSQAWVFGDGWDIDGRMLTDGISLNSRNQGSCKRMEKHNIFSLSYDLELPVVMLWNVELDGRKTEDCVHTSERAHGTDVETPKEGRTGRRGLGQGKPEPQ